MVGTSLRNLMAQVTTLLVTSFVQGDYEKPTNLPGSASLSHKVMETVTGQKLKPIQPFQQLNYDITSTYVWGGIALDDNSSDKWARVSVATQARGARNRTSPFLNQEEIKYNGIMVKWCEGASAAGHLMSMVAIFSGFSKTVMPAKGFMVLEVPGSVNASLDARNRDKGQNEDMKQFFEWYDNSIIYPYYQKLLQLYSLLPNSIVSLPEDLHARVWVDSDMTQMS